MSASRKKVVIRLRGGELHRGYLPAWGLAGDSNLDLLLPDGRAACVPLDEVKYIAYVKDFNLDDATGPERLAVRTFASKPRGTGVWIQVRFADEEVLQGLAHGGLAFLDSLLLDRGIFLDPPDRRGNTQRLFVPRSALLEFQILGVAGSASPARKLAPASRNQGDLFGAADPD